MNNFKTAKEINDIVHEKMPQIIEYFVEVYGEAYRERITNRLNNTLCVFIKPSSRMTKSDKNYYYKSLDYLILENLDIINMRENFNSMSFISNFRPVDGGTFTSVRKNASLFTPVSVCFFRNLENLYDQTFFHELNHVIMSDAFVDSGKIMTRVGIKTFSVKLEIDGSSKLIYNEEADKRNALNEVYTDYLSTKVYEVAKNKGFKLGEGSPVHSIYSYAFCLFKGLFEDNSEMFVDCFLNGNIDQFINYVGVENFNILRDMAHRAIYDEYDYYNRRIRDKAYDELKQTLDEVYNNIAKKKIEEDIDYILD